MNWLEAQAYVSTHLEVLRREAKLRVETSRGGWTWQVYRLKLEVRLSRLEGEEEL